VGADAAQRELILNGTPQDATIVLDDGARTWEAAVARVDEATVAVTLDGLRREVRYALAPDGTIWIGRDGWALPVRQVGGAAEADAVASGSLVAQMPGLILAVKSAAGATVAAGDPVIIMESMKMELTLAAPIDGVVTDVAVAEGDRVAVGDVLATVEPGPSDEGAQPTPDEDGASR
jgi:acetyl-CoA/propionyl-CoA carboxylase biotin carboxyl carrier protein